MRDEQRANAVPARSAWLVLLGLTALGAVLRLHHLGSGLWFDEIKTLLDAVRPPLAEVLTNLAGDNDHPLYSVLAHLSIQAFGESAWSLRLPAAVAGIATIPVLYLFGTRVTGHFEALAAAALLTLSYHHVWFSQNARGYTLLLLWTLAATHLLLRALDHERPRTYVAYGLIAALGTYTHLTMVFVVVSHGLVVLADVLSDPVRRARATAWLNPALGFGLAATLTLLLYGPLLLDVQQAAQPGPVGPRSSTGVEWAVLEFVRQLEVGFAVSAAGALGAVLFVVGCWSYFRQSRTVLALMLTPAALMFLAPLLLERPIRPRFFFFLGGFVVLIVVRGAIVVGTRITRMLPPGVPQPAISIALLLTIALVSALALPSAYRYPKQDYQGALEYVEDAAGGAPVVVAGGGAAVPYQRYYGLAWQRLGGDDELEALLRDHDTVWLLYTLPSYIQGYEPELWRAIRVNCSPKRTFPGTVGDGDLSVEVCRAG